MPVALPDRITAIHYINMPGNSERHAMIQKLLARFPYPAVRIPGIKFDRDKSEFQPYLAAGLEPYLQTHEHQNGIIGCWIAHTRALEAISPGQEGLTVILEDDFDCQPGFFKAAVKKLTAFGRPYDVIICDAWGRGPLPEHRVAEQFYQPRQCNYPYYGGAHCLFVHNQSAAKLLRLIDRSPIKDYDGFLIDNEQLDVYLLYTGLSSLKKVRSDIRGD